jgi:hypothetical protein
MRFFWLFALAATYRSVVAFPLSYTQSTVGATLPLIVISISLFFLVALFVAVKLVYMKHRRIGTIHAPPTVRSIPGFRDKQRNRHRGLLVGCLGSPTWETTLRSKLDGAPWRRGQRQRSSFAYQLQTRSTHTPSTRSKSKNSSSGSRFTKSTAFTSYSSHADGSSHHGGSCASRHCSVHRTTPGSSNNHPRYGDFGEFHGARSPGGGVHQVARRASPSSIRLVDGPSHSSHVDFAFLSALPPNAIVASPLMGARDSFQLSRCSMRCDRRPGPVPPMPSLPLFLPFYLSSGHEAQARENEYLPPLRFSPLASVARVFYSQQQALEIQTPSSRVCNPDERSNVASWRHAASPDVTQEIQPRHPETNTQSNHKRSHSCKGLAIGGPLPDEVVALPLDDKRCSEVESMQTDVQRTLSGSYSVTSRKPLKSCLRQPSVASMPLGSSRDSTLTPSMSETSTQTCGTSLGTKRSTCDQVSLRMPISDDDIGMLGLDRFHWNDEIKELKVRSFHMKKDSVALVPVWE